MVFKPAPRHATVHVRPQPYGVPSRAVSCSCACSTATIRRSIPHRAMQLRMSDHNHSSCPKPGNPCWITYDIPHSRAACHVIAASHIAASAIRPHAAYRIPHIITFTQPPHAHQLPCQRAQSRARMLAGRGTCISRRALWAALSCRCSPLSAGISCRCSSPAPL